MEEIIMGLDMYLEKVNRNDSRDKDEVHYWRKANSIHNWILKETGTSSDFNAGDNDIEITKDMLIKFVEQAKTVLKDRSDETSERLIPSCSGFFFGSTEYDEWYYDDIKDTAEKFLELVNTFDFEGYKLLYSCSW